MRTGEQPFVAFEDLGVALASHLFETGAIFDGDDTPALADQARLLKCSQHDTDGGPLDTEHFRKKLMGQREVILIDPIPCAQNPVAATCFDRMNGIAGNCLKGLREERLGVAEDQTWKLWICADRLLHPAEGDPRCGARDVHRVASEGFARDEHADQAEQPLAPEGCHLDEAAILHDIDETHDGIVREKVMPDCVTGIIEHVAFGQIYKFEVRLEESEIVGVQGSEE